METIEDTQSLTTPSGKHTLVAKTYLTGADKRSNRKLILQITEGGKGRVRKASMPQKMPLLSR